MLIRENKGIDHKDSYAQELESIWDLKQPKYQVLCPPLLHAEGIESAAGRLVQQKIDSLTNSSLADSIILEIAISSLNRRII